MQFRVCQRYDLFLYRTGIILLLRLFQGQPFQPLSRESELNNAPFYISSSGHLAVSSISKSSAFPATPAVPLNQERQI